MRKVTLLFILIGSSCVSQIDSTHFLNLYYGIGYACPVGSFSKFSKVNNQLGKKSGGLSMKAGVEYIINKNNSVSLDYDYSIFMNCSNDSLSRIVKRRVDSYSMFYNSPITDDQFDIVVSHYYFGYARLFNFKKLTVQAKVNCGLASLGYDYTSSYLLSNGFSAVSTNSFTSISLFYSCLDYTYLTIKPEIGLKYFLKSKEAYDIVLAGTLGYYYANPKVVLYENNNSKLTKIITIRDRINSVNFNLSFNLILKKTILSKLFS